MAISARMLAVVQKVDAAEAEYFAALRTRAVADRIRSEKSKRALAARKKAALAVDPVQTEPARPRPLRHRTP
jgi:hypothetical protein